MYAECVKDEEEERYKQIGLDTRLAFIVWGCLGV